MSTVIENDFVPATVVHAVYQVRTEGQPLFRSLKCCRPLRSLRGESIHLAIEFERLGQYRAKACQQLFAGAFLGVDAGVIRTKPCMF